MSKTIRQMLLATSAVALLGALPAFAHEPGPAGGPDGDRPAHHERHDRQERREHMAQRMAEHQQQLKEALKLTPAQESAWSRYVDAFKRPEQPPQRPDREAFARMTTPERLDFMQARQAERDAHMGRIVDATRALYGSLTPAQQKVFDARALPGRPPMPHEHGKG